MTAPVSCPSASSAARSWLTARLWSNRRPALIVSRFPTVSASLANAATVMNWPPPFEGSLEVDCDGCPLLSRYHVPVGITRSAWFSPWSYSPPVFHS